jgi:hypothetical protein
VDRTEVSEASTGPTDEEIIELLEEAGYDIVTEEEAREDERGPAGRSTPVADPDLAEASGFLPGTLLPDSYEQTAPEGYFEITVDIETTPDFTVSMLHTDSQTRLIKTHRLSSIGYDDLYVTEELEGKLVFRLRFPEAGTYEVKIFAPKESGTYWPAFEYRVEVRRGLGKIDYYHKVIYELLEEENEKLLDVIRDRHRAPFVVSDSSGTTPLLEASAEGNTQVVDYIFDYDPESFQNAYKKDLAAVNGRDPKGRTPLIRAAAAGHTEIVRTLLKENAAAFIADDTGRTALDYARQNGDREISGILEEYPVLPSEYSAEDLVGSWRGVLTTQATLSRVGTSSLYMCDLEIKRGQEGLTAEGIITGNVKADDARRLLSGERPDVELFENRKQCAVFQEFDIFMSGKDIAVIGRESDYIFNNPEYPRDDVPRFKLVGALSDGGIYHGYTDGDKKNMFYLEKRNVGVKSGSSEIERGKTVTVRSDLFPGITYSCYVPRNLDGSRPASLLIFGLPGDTEANPLSPVTAEELGWIAVGSHGENFDAPFIIADLKDKFRIPDGRIFLAGFSKTVKINNILTAGMSPLLGGVIDMGGYYTGGVFAADYGVPVFFIMGTDDHINGEHFKNHLPRLNELYGDRVRGRLFEAGHSWWAPELHAEAMRWLDGMSR